MAELKEDYRKEERINGIVYDMSPSADYRHGIVNSNIQAASEKQFMSFFYGKSGLQIPA